MIGILTLGAIALGLVGARKQQTGIGRVKRRIYRELSVAQGRGVDFNGKYFDLTNSQMDAVKQTGEEFGWKQTKRSVESGKSYGEAYFNSLRRAYNAICGVSGIGATRYNVRNADGKIVLTWTDLEPAVEHLEAEPAAAPIVEEAKASSRFTYDSGKFGFGGEKKDWEHGYKVDKDAAKELREITLIARKKYKTERTWRETPESDNECLKGYYGIPLSDGLRSADGWETIGRYVKDGESPFLFWYEHGVDNIEQRKSVIILFAESQTEYLGDFVREHAKAQTDKANKILALYPYLQTWYKDGDEWVKAVRDDFTMVNWITRKTPDGTIWADGPVEAFRSMEEAEEYIERDYTLKPEKREAWLKHLKPIEKITDKKLQSVSGIGAAGDWYGIPGIKIIWHGEWADPELYYNGNTYNSVDVEDWLYADYKEDTMGLDFETWVQVSEQYVKDLLDYEIQPVEPLEQNRWDNFDY